MSQTTFPSGQTLYSSALAPPQMEQIFQYLVIQIFGTPLTPVPPSTAFSKVRCAWQKDGQPSFELNNDYCVISAYPLNEAYSRTRDALLYPNNDITNSLDQEMSYTQVWRIHFTLYGPNCWDNGRLIVSTIGGVDWAHDWLENGCAGLSVQPIYALADWTRPVYAPELFQRRWWQRTDLDMKFNELVREAIVVESALSDEVIITTDTGETQTVEIVVPS